MLEQPIIFVNKREVSGLLRPKDFVVYLKTTETCQLNCKHCFTNGTNGKKIYFDVENTINWFKNVHHHCPTFNSGTIIFHGGEPLLAPIEDLYKVWEEVSVLWPNINWSCSTNLTYNLTEEHLKFFKKVFIKGFCTSWDKSIRFANQKQEDLWLQNLKTVINQGHNITLNVSLNKELIEMDTNNLVEWLNTLGVNYVQFERLTYDGNALDNMDIFPTNVSLNEWFVKMHDSYQTIKPSYKDVLLEGIYMSFNGGIHGGVRCRDCEQKIFTVNADGTISGCPNTAVNNGFGHITQDFMSVLGSNGRINNIQCEINRDSRCYTCNVFDICNSDCHQLKWQNDVCAAPKKLMQRLKKENDNTR